MSKPFEPGDRVVYRTPHTGEPEYGSVIRSGSDGSVVFVHYDGDQHPKATRRQDLVRADAGNPKVTR